MGWWRLRRRAAIEPELGASDTRDQRLSAYLDDDLDTADAELLAAELEADPELRTDLEGLREVKSALSGLGEERAPRAFTLEAPPRPARGVPRLEFAARVGAAVAALAFVAVIAGDLRSAPSEPVADSQTSQAEFASGAADEDAAGGAAGSATAGEDAPASAPAAPSEEGGSRSSAPEYAPITPTAVDAPSDLPAQVDPATPNAGPAVRPQIAPAGTPVVDPATPSAPQTAPAPTLEKPDSGAGEGSSGEGAPDAPATGELPGDLAGRGAAPNTGGAGDADIQPPEAAATPPATLLTREVTVERNEIDAVRTAEVVLGAAVLLLVAAAAGLWYARRQGIIGR